MIRVTSNWCQASGIGRLAAAVACLLIAGAPWAAVAKAKPPDEPAATTQPDDGDDVKSDDRRPPLGGPGGDRPRRPWRDGRTGDRPGRVPGDDGIDDLFGEGPDGPRNEPRGPRNRRGPGREAGEGPPPIPADVMLEVEKIIQEETPELYNRMADWRRRHPHRYEQAMARFHPALREFMMVRRHNPEMAGKVLQEIRIEIRLRRLSLEYRASSTADDRRTAIEKEMETLATQQIELRFARQEARIRMLEDRLAREKERLERDKGRIDEMSKTRLKEIKEGRFNDPTRRPRDGRRPPMGPPHEGEEGPGGPDPFGAGADGPPPGEE